MQLSAARKYTLFLLVALLCLFGKVNAQLKANFTIDKNSGCSPLTVSFTNTTTGASASVTYTWDFGNGNSSTLPSPGATYKNSQSYTVLLKAKDGAQTSTQTSTIIVYKNPVINFNGSPAKGCFPLPVLFSSTSTAGDGTIADYFWDFGDGTTQHGGNLQKASHIYTFAQNAAVSLTVTNSYGCYNTQQISGIVQVLGAITADFSAPTTVCNASDAVNFTNTSSGPGTLSYIWDFGDNTSSTDPNPSHIYNKSGSFTVKLTVNSSDGCTDNVVKTSYINVANFKVDFNAPATSCQNAAATLTDKSTAGASSASWLIDGVPSYQLPGNWNPTFNTPGDHIVQLNESYGGCTLSASKKITIKKAPVLNGFVMTSSGSCGAPAIYQFKDTSAGTTKWQWNFSGIAGASDATTQTASHSYPTNGNFPVLLTATNADGCSSSVTQFVNLGKPDIRVYQVKSSSVNGNSGCNYLTTTLAATPPGQISAYQWNFGDGTAGSTAAQPEHTYANPGIYTVKLNYTTVSGCKGESDYGPISIYTKPKADFISQSGTNICGNTPVNFKDRSTGTVTNWTWDFGDGVYSDVQNFQNPTPQYSYAGTFTVRLIASNGTCSDTISKINYITVSPPFPHILEAVNSCDGNHGLVKFPQDSYGVLKWTWDFGDGTTASYNSLLDTTLHTYAKTGIYKIILTAVNGQCVVKDSNVANVLIRQSPLLSSTSTSICENSTLTATVSNLEFPPYQIGYAYNYDITKIQYGDGKPYTGTNPGINGFNNNDRLTFSGLTPGEQSIRLIVNSAFLHCPDTTNLLTVQIKGPIVGFKFVNNNVCYRSPVIVQDTSKATFNSTLKTWEWDFGDGQKLTATNNQPVSHVYANPGSYAITLKVTDQDGCFSTGSVGGQVAKTNGPKASYVYSPPYISPNAQVNFTNTTNTGNSSTVQYNWDFGDGNSSTATNPVHTYPNLGAYKVRLIAKDMVTGCTDTTVQVLNVKNVFASFNSNTSYINKDNCPPLVASFVNTSTNALKISWDFGDGSSSDNQTSVSHTYNKAGIFLATLYAYGLNNTVDSIIDTIIVKGPYAIIEGDPLQGCLSQAVTLKAVVKNAASYTWDFADGTLLHTADTFAVHQYQAPGVYNPSLILQDRNGCSATSDLGKQIVIDSLSVAFKKIPAIVCDSGRVNFEPSITSVAKDVLGQTLSYHWELGPRLGDTSDLEQPGFYYNQLGKYRVLLTVSSPYGCIKQAFDTVIVLQKPQSIFSGPAIICQGDSAKFISTSVAPATAAWHWDFKNGNLFTAEQPPFETYLLSGNYTVSLIVNNGACYDTATHDLKVNPWPAITILPEKPVLCLGKSIPLTADGGTSYSWSPAIGLDLTNGAVVNASPSVSTEYHVKVINEFGCSKSDSTWLQVAGPFSMDVSADTFVCMGNNVQLRASGAQSYNWISGTGLSSIFIPNPVASPVSNSVYTVVGYDGYNCFTDTATVKVTVEPLPTVQANPDLQLLTGSEYQFAAIGSSDVEQWTWSPPDNLSCSDCPNPVATPRFSGPYIVTGKTQFGCTASDTINVKLICAQDKVYIPNAFTPNYDGKNDVFYVKGKGIRSIKSFRIFNRWGQLIFEKTNASVNDRSAGWDGRFNGTPVSTGTYVYITELVCDTGEIFPVKGTVVVVH